MEYLDAVNQEDQVIGSYPKPEIYARRITHRIVHVLIFNKNDDLLLQLRSKQKTYLPGYWSTSVGGHVQAGESYEDAAKREMLEEVGIEASLTFLGKDLFFDNQEQMSKQITTFTVLHDGPFFYNEKEVSALQGFPLTSIQAMILKGGLLHPQLLFILNKYYHLKI